MRRKWLFGHNTQVRRQVLEHICQQYSFEIDQRSTVYKKLMVFRNLAMGKIIFREWGGGVILVVAFKLLNDFVVPCLKQIDLAPTA